MKRMSVIAALVIGVSAVLAYEHAHTRDTKNNDTDIPTGECRCIPGLPCWPGKDEWQQLSDRLTGKLVQPQTSISACQKNAVSEDCKAALQTLSNPFAIGNNPGDTQSQGWMGAWINSPSTYAVEAANANDVAAAVKFAHEHNLRVVIKGAGHDYLGRNNAPNSLLIWTHNMREVSYNESFIPAGCPTDTAAIPVIQVGAGTRWLEAYDMATNKHNQYVQGGGCTTVGAAGGFTQGGGFGQFSKQYGTGSAGIAEVEVVTANGNIVTANDCQNSDLFWAIRGGGGGTFGVVTKMTLKLHPLPASLGLIEGTISAKDDDAYKALISKFIGFYRDKLNNQNWGEQIKFNDKNEIGIFMMYQGISKDDALHTFDTMQDWVNDNQDKYTMKMAAHSIANNKLWNLQYMQKNYPQLVTLNKAKGAGKDEFWWTPNSGEVSAYWFTYQSWWLPEKLLSDSNNKKLTDTIFNASRLTTVAWHINKGLAGASEAAKTEGRKTATHPGVYDAAALVIMSARTNAGFIGVNNKEPDQVKGENQANNITEAMQMFYDLAPDAGTYANEADYNMEHWQQAFWGSNYAQLLKIKKKYDPDGLFFCHHCVGSEVWSDNGMCRL